MQAAYRVIQFLPNPVRPLRIPFAALVRAGESLDVVTASPLPGVEILGSKESSAVLQLIVERLRGTQDFDRLPGTVGPHATLEPPRIREPAGAPQRLSIDTVSGNNAKFLHPMGLKSARPRAGPCSAAGGAYNTQS
jgi:hypothetical protein